MIRLSLQQETQEAYQLKKMSNNLQVQGFTLQPAFILHLIETQEP